MKKSWHGILFLMIILFLPKTAYAAENRKLPALPTKIFEHHTVLDEKYHQIKYELLVKQKDRNDYFADLQSIDYFTDGQEWRVIKSGKKRVSPAENATVLHIWKNVPLDLKTGDIFILNFRDYPKLRLTMKGRTEEPEKIVWDIDWDILDESGTPIADPLSFAKERATAQIKSLANLHPEDQEKYLSRLDTKTEYRDVYAVYEQAFIRNGATPAQLALYSLLDESERLLTEEEVAELERAIEICQISQQVRETEAKIRTAAAKTLSNLDLEIEEPKSGKPLPLTVATTPEGIQSCKLTWLENGEARQGEAKENTAYTAQCQIKLVDGKRLIVGKSKMTVNGTDANAEPQGTDGEYGLTYTFPKTEVLTRTYETIWEQNNGSGAKNSTTVTDAKLKLPECTFPAPAGKVFDTWLVGGTPYSVGNMITLTEGTTTIRAQWKDKPASSDTDAPRVPEYRASQVQTVRMHASDGSGTYVEGPAEALGNVHELVVERRTPNLWNLSLRDLSGREVYSDRLMFVTVPVESFGTENLRLLVDGVYTSFSVSEDGKSVTFPAYFTKDGKRPAEDLLLLSDGIEVYGNSRALPEEGCRFVIEKKSAAKFEVNLVNARGETVHTTGPVWISFAAPDGNATHWRVKCDGRETTFEIVNGRVRVAAII